MSERVLVVGADAAGMSAASQAKRLRGDDLEVVALERGHHTSFSACGIPYWIGGDVDSVDQLVARTAEQHRANGIDLRMRTEAVGLDLDRREAEVRDHEGGSTYRLGFDHLVLATGARPRRPDLPGIDAAGVFGVQTLDDGERVLDALQDGPRRAVVVGGGYIGVEMAEAMVNRGLSVTVATRSAEPMVTLDPDMGRQVHDAMTAMGIDVLTSVRVDAFETGDDGHVRAVVTDQGELPADLVVLGTGVSPETTLAAGAGLPLGRWGGLTTDLQMRVFDAPGVWAAGDCVESIDLVSGNRVHVALGTHANKQGRVLGTNLGGGYATFPGVVGTAVSKVCDLEIARTGLRERDCEAVGVRPPDRQRRLDDARRLLPRCGACDGQAGGGAAHGAAARRADRGPGGLGQADRRAGRRPLEPDDGRGDLGPGPGLRAAVLARVGPGAHRGAQGGGRGARGLRRRSRRAPRSGWMGLSDGRHDTRTRSPPCPSPRPRSTGRCWTAPRPARSPTRRST